MSRMCGKCGQPLSAYNPENRCGACAVAARSDPLLQHSIRPALTFWFRSDISAALGAWDWQAVLVAVGNETGATQTKLASAIGVVPSAGVPPDVRQQRAELPHGAGYR
jgi:hypothetical protein